MNRSIFNICNYIINSKIKTIDISHIIKKFNKYIPIDVLNSEIFKYKIFQKLVLYNYCYNYQIDNISFEQVILIHNYINDIYSNKYLDVDKNMFNFIDWCKKYNRKNKNKIKIIFLDNC
jgi:hypothetical protein